MNSVVRMMNLSQSEAIGSDMLLYATVGGFADTFDVDIAKSFLNSPNAIQLENQFIQRGIAGDWA